MSQRNPLNDRYQQREGGNAQVSRFRQTSNKSRIFGLYRRPERKAEEEFLRSLQGQARAREEVEQIQCASR